MNQFIQSNEYDALIKKIKGRRTVVIVLSVIAVLIVLGLCSPFYIQILDKTIIDYKGINPIITIIFVLLLCLGEVIAYAFVSMPLVTSMDNECDPQKHLILNSVLNKQKNKDHIFAVDFFYLGNFQMALDYANKMIVSNKPVLRITGLFNKARSEFFLNDINSLRATVWQYQNVLNNVNRLNQKEKDVFIKIQKIMNLMLAISEADKEKISAFSDIEVWNNSKATEGYVQYLKGVVSYIKEDKKEAIYYFMSVKEICSKTFLSKMAEQYLLRLSDNIC